MTAIEIIKGINQIGLDKFCYEDYYDEDDPDTTDEILDKLGKFKTVAERGGSDQGSEWWHVFYFEDHDIFIKIQGYYSSYNGVDNLRAFEVEPKEVTITVYDKK